jgi:alginate O-acetyltransferase complex protein AlgI
MVFSSQVFLFYFLPVFLIGYFVLVWRGVRHSYLNLFITIFSYIFYGWMEPWLIVLMLSSTTIDYIAGRLISAEGASQRQRNVALTASIIANLSALGLFKYYMFFMGGLNAILSKFGIDTFSVWNVILPVGISFYTFQSMSYTIDVWRGVAPPAKNLATFSCYVALFPQLVAGPIVRYNTVAEELASRTHSMDLFLKGITFFCIGFAKKILIANQVGIIADRVFASDAPGILNSWWGSVAYMFQIYFDFSAYSDMAVGLGLMIGFHFPRNFNGPYRSASITEFWARWHISLTTWLRDYLYIALGGNRVSPRRLYFNLFVVMFISGFWHGANWTFIAWGLYHAFFMIVERYNGKQAIYKKVPFVFQVLITQVIVLFGWVLFRANTIGEAFSMWKSLLGLMPVSAADPLLTAQIFTPLNCFFMIIALFYAISPWRAFEWCQKLNVRRISVALFLFVFACLVLFTQSYNPFLYFQF